ncbi:MAG: glycosyltransferase [Brevinematia bacterium]
MDYLFIYLFSIFLINLFFLILTITNTLFLKKTSIFKKPVKTPFISVLIPARNEEKNIIPCIESLLNQNYPDYEVIVLNDNSTDGTEMILKRYEAYPNFRYYNGAELEYGWKGKTFASQQLLEYARGEICFFTDADTIHSPDTLSFLMGKMEEYDVDFLSGYAFHNSVTFGEKIIIPALYVMTVLFLPLFLVYSSRMPIFSFAIGQVIFAKKEVFDKIGGFEEIKNEVVEDMALGRKVKEYGFKTIFIDAKNYISCRMYKNYLEGFMGIARVIYPAISKSIFIFLGLVFSLFSLLEFPIIYLILNFNNPSVYNSLSIYSVFLFSIAWIISLYDRKQSVFSFVLYPFFFLNLILIATYSVLKIGFGKGIKWKERLVK